MFPKRKQGTGIKNVLDHIVIVAKVFDGNVSDHKVFNHKQLKILDPKQYFKD